MQLTIPQNDLPDFASYPDAARREVMQLLRVMEKLCSCAGRGIGDLIKRTALDIGLSPKTLRAKYDKFRKSKDWRDLVDNRRFPAPGQCGLPPGFVEWWKSIQMEYQRETTLAEAHRELLRRWEKMDHIPGYIMRPDAAPGFDHPEGWGYKNLSLPKNCLTRYEKKAIQIGRHAASDLLPKVLTTRVHLLAGEVVMFDDQDYDQNVNFLGVNKRTTRPSGFNAIDVLTGCEILQGYKPTVLNPDGSRAKLKQTDFEWFMVNHLTTIGYREDRGTLCIGERGTAKGGRDFVERVIQATNGKVSFDASGLHRAPVIPGLFEGAAKGNPRHKALREGMFRLVREVMASLPGQTGLDRDHSPEGDYGMQIENHRLIQAMAALPPNITQLFQMPYLNWHEWLVKAQTAYDIINGRDWHNLEGWERLNFITHEWRMDVSSKDWKPKSSYLALPDNVRTVFDALADQEPMLWKTRKLSPREVWTPRRAELKRVSGHCIPILLGEEHRREVRVTRDLHFIVQDQEIDPDEMWFYAIVGGRELVRGEVYQAYLNPFNATCLEVCDGRGRWLGTAQRVERVCKTNTEALQRNYAITRKVETDSLKRLAARGRDITKRETDRRALNLGIADLALGNNKPDPRLAKFETSTAAFLDDPQDAETFDDSPAFDAASLL